MLRLCSALTLSLSKCLICPMAGDLSIGLDLGSNTIKVVELTKIDKQKYRLLSIGSVACPPGGLLSESKIEQEAVAQAIKKLFKDAKISSPEARIALPESQVYTFVIETPALSEKELASSIKWEAEQYIPVPLDEVVLDWKILVQGNKQNEKNQVLLVAAPRRITEKYQKVLELVGITTLSLETELIAASRCLQASVPQLKTIMVVNLGAGTCDFSILNNGILLFTRSVGTGGNAMTRAIMQDLSLEEGQAEQYKKQYGIEEDKLEGKVANSLKPLINSIVEEMKKGIAFFKEKHAQEKLDVILLSGGLSLMPGLVSYLASKLEVETQIGNPLAFVEIDKKVQPNFTPLESSLYIVAIGLAMREI